MRALNENSTHMSELRDRLLDLLREGIGRQLTVNGDGAPRLPNTLSVNFPHVAGVDLLARIPELMASTGSACHSGETTTSNTLKAIGLAPHAARGTVRLSVGWYTSPEEIDRAAGLLLESWESLV
jgi:cysteine desulfurase